MIDILLTILGLSVFVPFCLSVRQAPFATAPLPRRLVLTATALLLTTLLYLPITVFYAFGLLALAFLYYCWRKRPAFRITPLACVAFAYWLWHVVSIAWSPAPLKGLQFAVDQLPPLVICLIPCWITFTRDEVAAVLRPFCYAACIFVMLCLMSAAITFAGECPGSLTEWPLLNSEGRWAGREFFYDATFRFMHYHHPSYNTLPLFFAGLSAAWLSREHRFPIALTVLLTLLIPVVGFLAQSRMALLYSAILWTANLLYALPTRRLRAIVAAALAAGGLVLAVVAWPRLQTMRSDNVRDDMHTFTWQYIRCKPWLGAGAGALNPIEMGRTIGVSWWPRLGPIDTTMPVSQWRYKTRMLPHNQFLADWAHAGILSMLLCVALYATIGFNCLKKRDYPMSLFLLIFLLLSLLEPPLFIAKGLYLFALIGALSTYSSEKCTSTCR